LMGYVAMGWAVAPMLAPLVGGGLDTLFGWRASFWAFLAFGSGMLALCWMDLGETNRRPSRTFTAQVRSYLVLLGSRRFWGYALCMRCRSVLRSRRGGAVEGLGGRGEGGARGGFEVEHVAALVELKPRAL